MLSNAGKLSSLTNQQKLAYQILMGNLQILMGSTYGE